MRRFLVKTILFFIPLLCWAVFAITLLPNMVERYNGPSTKTQIERSFKLAESTKYNLLILGNSRFYRGINPDYLSIKSFNFSHDNDSYNQLYYKLQYLLDKQKKPDYLLLSVDYFQFSFISDTRNYVYADYFDESYRKDYNSNPWILKLYYYIEYLSPKKLLLLKELKEKPFQKENGQYIKPGRATKDDKRPSSTKILSIQLAYFEKILEVCRQNEIPVFLVMLPVRENEIVNYTAAERDAFNLKIQQYSQKYGCQYWRYDLDQDFSISDFTDITHLNEDAANRFTKKLDKKLQDYINRHDRN